MNLRHSRQSFLGRDLETIISTAKLGIVGLSGGGSHLVQQLGHIGFRRFAIYDPDHVDESNLNRLVGATFADVKEATPKVDVARRVLQGLIGDRLEVEAYAGRWQHQPTPLRECDLIFGCLDGFAERAELEICARRYLIPYIDVGLDVHTVSSDAPRMGGQVILSLPGGPCMHCLGFLTEERLAKEAATYGDVGIRPQVVWANGVLASTAVGIAVDLFTDWTGSCPKPIYLSYDGNRGTMSPHVRLQYISLESCPHFAPAAVGDPLLKPL